jgi:riboflavin kinase / FMN adenylyltransferase
LALTVHPGSLAYDGPDCVLTIGNFDGVHKGHQALIKQNQARAKASGLASVLYTFEPHPRQILQPNNHPPRILSLNDKLELIGDLGIEHVVVEPFDATFSDHPAEWFAKEIIHTRMQAKALVIGHDFRFGKAREGNAERLKAWLPDLPLERLKAVEVGAVIASSSRIREAVAHGAVDQAKKLMGRPYTVHGRVVEGHGKGREIGFPTANLNLSSSLIPGHGVYAVRVRINDQTYQGVSNLGVRPTFGKHQFCFEVHLLDNQMDLYDKVLEVQMIQRIRAEQKFKSVAELQAQIKLDIKAARGILLP